MRLVSLAVALLLGCFAWEQGAAASTITQTIDFTASDIVTLFGGPPAPVSTVTGSVTITFDPTQIYNDEGSGIVLNNININTGGFGGTPVFSYFTGPFTANQFLIGMSLNGAGGSGSGSNDFILSLSYDNPALFPAYFSYVQDGSGYTYAAGTVAVTFSPALAATPIPGSVLMLLTGLGAMGGVAFARPRKAEAIPAVAAV